MLLHWQTSTHKWFAMLLQQYLLHHPLQHLEIQMPAPVADPVFGEQPDGNSEYWLMLPRKVPLVFKGVRWTRWVGFHLLAVYSSWKSSPQEWRHHIHLARVLCWQHSPWYPIITETSWLHLLQAVYNYHVGWNSKINIALLRRPCGYVVAAFRTFQTLWKLKWAKKDLLYSWLISFKLCCSSKFLTVIVRRGITTRLLLSWKTGMATRLRGQSGIMGLLLCGRSKRKQTWNTRRWWMLRWLFKKKSCV